MIKITAAPASSSSASATNVSFKMTSGANIHRILRSSLAIGMMVWCCSWAGAAPTTTMLADVPLYFEANHGQNGSAAEFLAQGKQSQFLISPDSAEMILFKPTAHIHLRAIRAMHMQIYRRQFRSAGFGGWGVGRKNQLSYRQRSIEMGEDKPSDFRESQCRWSIYPGIDLVYYGNQRQLEYDFTVAPGADPNSIAIPFCRRGWGFHPSGQQWN